MEKKRASERFTVTIFLLTGIMVLFAWVHSVFPAKVSSWESLGILQICYRFFKLFGLSFQEAHTLLRKLAHFSEYAAIGGLLLSCGYCFDRFKPRRFTVPVLFGGLMTALIDETIQLFVEGRVGLVTDIWIDFGGVVFGTAVMLGVYRLHNRRKKK